MRAAGSVVAALRFAATSGFVRPGANPAARGSEGPPVQRLQSKGPVRPSPFRGGRTGFEVRYVVMSGLNRFLRALSVE
ncbi:hypothetical protein GCM10009558_053900 [Virgisporangium aurantiacum]